MGDFNLHKVKRQARKEAWYDKPGEKPTYNPFKRARTTTWSEGSREYLHNNGGTMGPDLEAGNGVPHTERASTEPPQTATRAGDPEKDVSSSPDTAGNSRTSDPTSETIVPSNSTGTARLPSAELTARKRFLNRFHKNKNSEDLNGTGDVPTRRETGSKSLKHHKFTVRNQLKGTLFNSWINILILCAPVGIIMNYINVAPVAVFVINFIAIIPLAALLSYATEEIALRIGETLGGLMNATFGNAVELIVAILALVKKETVIVKTSLIGSMLSNLLLVMGMCFFFGGLRRPEQHFNVTVAGTAASLLALATGSLIIPTAFSQFSTGTSDAQTATNVTALSRGTAIILFLVYCCYLYFQLHTHSAMFAEESQKVAMKPGKNTMVEGGIQKGIAMAGGVGAAHGRVKSSISSHPDQPGTDELMDTAATLDEDEADEPQLHLHVAIATLVISTVIIALCAEFMVDSIGALTKNGAVSEEFVGLILLPIVGNAAEHATAVTVACKDKMDLAIGVAVGSSMQVALLVIPLAVLLGWILNVTDMNLDFDGFLITVVFVAVLLVNYLIGDGKSHWLEGVMLMALYVIIAVTAWYYPAVGDVV